MGSHIIPLYPGLNREAIFSRVRVPPAFLKHNIMNKLLARHEIKYISANTVNYIISDWGATFIEPGVVSVIPNEDLQDLLIKPESKESGIGHYCYE